MAAGLLRSLAGEEIEVLSAGSEPVESINPAAVVAMAEKGIDISDATPSSWTDEILGSADVIVTMGCGDSCPFIPGKRYLDWELDDPSGKSVDEVRVIRDQIELRVRTLMTELGVGSDT
jgi:arsenate reductase (thioredoxin)